MVESYSVKPLSPIRRVIAARMVEAKQTIPHFRLSDDIEVDALLELRKEVNGPHCTATISLNDLLIKACASALIDTPAINIQWVSGEIHQYRSADISVVTALEDGISTPIIRSVESKTIWQISRELKDLRVRAARNALKMEEIFGGTCSISNLGMYGVRQFDAIINSPQCAILAVGCAKPSLVVSPDRRPRIGTVLRVTLSVDHRAIDGVTAAEFLSAFRHCVEYPACLRSGTGNC